MIHQDLLKYIREQKARGIEKRDIKSPLLANGWTEPEVDEALQEVFGLPGIPGVPLPPRPQAPLSTQQSIDQMQGDQPTVSQGYVGQHTADHSVQAAYYTSPENMSGVGRLLAKSWGVFTARFKTLFSIVLIPIVVMSLASMLSTVTDNGFVLFVAAVIALIFSFWGHISLLYAVVTGPNTGFVDAYRNSWKKIYSYAWVTILSGVIVFGAIMLFIIPGILFAIWFSFTLFVFFGENERGMKALLRSKEYVRGRWWGVFGRFLFLFVIVMILSLLVGFIVKLIPLKILSSTLGAVLQSCIVIMAILYTSIMYFELKDISGPIEIKDKKRYPYILTSFLGFLVLPIIGFITFGHIWLTPQGVLSGVDDSITHTFDARRWSDMRQIELGLEMYFDSFGMYPMLLSELNTRGYMVSVSVLSDPVTGKPYFYEQLNAGSGYHLGTNLENKKNSLLELDADIEGSVIKGGDESGCNGEENVYCYDLRVVKDEEQ